MERTLALQAWLSGLFPAEKWHLEPASADASFRRYFRISLADRGESRIVMDAPPQQEDCRPFIQIADLLRQAGLNAPAVLARCKEMCEWARALGAPYLVAIPSFTRRHRCAHRLATRQPAGGAAAL